MVFETKPNLNDNYILLIIIGAAILFFVFVMPMIESRNTKENLSNVNADSQIPKIDTNICSKQCCKHAQWPLPNELLSKDIPEEKLANYVGSNFSCNFGSGSGCLCLTKDNFDYLAKRGTNAGSNMCSN
jgi:hypothetical protein